jgi:hypothetical protein
VREQQGLAGGLVGGSFTGQFIGGDGPLPMSWVAAPYNTAVRSNRLVQQRAVHPSNSNAGNRQPDDSRRHAQ